MTCNPEPSNLEMLREDEPLPTISESCQQFLHEAELRLNSEAYYQLKEKVEQFEKDEYSKVKSAQNKVHF